ncbi:MAG: penicillin acylase family protein, partial [Planctomycetota bacterium]
VPSWVDGARPEDTLALLHCYLMSMAPFDLPEAYRLPPAAQSGNAWALGPQRSVTGEPILVLNPHTNYRGPFQWYEAHLVCQDLNMAGATLFGLPMLLQGHNEALGWGLTPNNADFADVYMESPPKLGGTGKGRGRRGPALDDPSLTGALIGEVKAYFVQTPSGIVQRHVRCFETSRGPVVGRFRGKSCSFRAGGYGEFGALRQLVEMGRARDLAGFQTALAMGQLPCFHVVYADRDGNIFYLYNAKVGEKASMLPSQISDATGAPMPETARVIDWEAPVPGDDPLFTWGPIVAVDGLPAVRNPASGCIQACGNPPWRINARSEIKKEDWPAWFVRDRDTYRARRARRLLGMGRRSFYDAQSMLYDVLAPFAAASVPKLLGAAEAYPDFIEKAHPDLPLGLTILDQWNYAAEKNSAAMTFFRVWFSSLQGLVAPQIQSAPVLMDALMQDDPQMQQLSLQAASDAAMRMRNVYQSLTVPWGSVHRIQRGDRDEPLPGAATGEPLFVASDWEFADNAWRVTYGYGYAMAVKFGPSVEAVSMVPFGASEDPDSPHYDDQLDLLVQRRFKRARFERGDICRYAESGYGRTIELGAVGLDGVVKISADRPVQARVKISEIPPIELPAGVASYTPFVLPEIVPSNAEIAVDITVSIPAEQSAAEDLPFMAVCTYDGRIGWVALQVQTLAPETRTFTARDRRTRVYAVLGPPRSAATLAEPVDLPAPEERPQVTDLRVDQAEPAPESVQEVWSPVERPTFPVDQPARTRARKPVFIVHDDEQLISEKPTAVPSEVEPPEKPDADVGVGTPKRLLVIHEEGDRPKQDGTSLDTVVLDESQIKATGATFSGTVLEIRPPGVDATFHVGADIPIRARLLVLDELLVAL